MKASYCPNTLITMDKNRKTDHSQKEDHHESRRDFLKTSSILTAIAVAPSTIARAAEYNLGEKISTAFETTPVNLTVNGVKKQLSIEPRSTLLDVLREQLDLTGTKKGCDYGQCGACTVHVDGQRVLSCLSLAIMQEGKQVKPLKDLQRETNYIRCSRLLSNTTVSSAGTARLVRSCLVLPVSMKDMRKVKKKSGNL